MKGRKKYRIGRRGYVEDAEEEEQGIKTWEDGKEDRNLKYRRKLGLQQNQEHSFLDTGEKEVWECEPRKEKDVVIKSSREDPGKQWMPCWGGWDWNKNLNSAKYRLLGWTDEPKEGTKRTRGGKDKKKSYNRDGHKKPVPNELSFRAYSEKIPESQFFIEKNC